MSSMTQDIGSLYGTHKVGNQEITIAKKGSNLDLDMTDFITLMITQLTSQGIDDTMDTSEMLNQMVQMQMITSMVNMTDAVTMNYAASLVGKEVTVGKYGDDGKLQEVVGTVTATGTMDGEQVIFVNDEYYYLSDIMAVGKLPPPQEDEDDKTEGAGKVEGADKPGESTGTPSETQKPGETQPDETVQPGGGTETPEYSGENGTPQGAEG